MAEDITMSSEEETILSEEEAEKYIDAALLAGELTVTNGAETVKCEETMNYIISSSNVSDYAVSILIPSVFARVGKHTKFIKTETISTDFNKVVRTNEVSRNLSSGKISIDEAYQSLLEIKSKRIYSLWFQIVGYVLVLSSLPVFYGGRLADSVAGIIAGAFMAFFSMLLKKIRTRAFVIDLLQILLMTLFVNFMALITKGKINPDVIVISALYAVLPGLTMTNAVRDVIHGYYVSGNSRIMMAAVKTLSIVGGALLGILISFTFITEEFPMVYGGYVDGTKWYVLLIAAYIVALGYGIMQEVPLKYIAVTAAIGCIGRLVYIGAKHFNLTGVLGVFISAVIITILSHISARIAKAPASLFLVSGIMALLPGYQLYESLMIMTSGAFLDGLDVLFGALLTAGAIAFGIFLVDVIVDAGTLARKKELIRK